MFTPTRNLADSWIALEPVADHEIVGGKERIGATGWRSRIEAISAYTAKQREPEPRRIQISVRSKCALDKAEIAALRREIESGCHVHVPWGLLGPFRETGPCGGRG
jgi:hypothetical protein